MNIKHLEYFAKTCQYKSISQAASSLFISQPSLSYSLKAIEDELGFKLFERSLNGIVLTPNGKIVLEDTEIILNLVQKWNSLTEDTQRIAIEADGVLSDFLVPYLMAVYQKEHSDIILYSNGENVQEKLTHHPATEQSSILMFDMISDDVDTVTAMAQENGWNYQVITEIPNYILMNSHHPLVRKKELTVQDLLNHSSIVIHLPLATVSHQNLWNFINLFDKKQIVHTPNRAATMRLISMSETMISVGTSFSVQNNEFIKNNSIVAVQPIDFSLLSTMIAFYYARERKNSIEKIIQLAKHYILSDLPA